MKYRLLLILPASLLLSGCLGSILSIMCDATPDSDHCFQAAAVQEADPEDCSNVSGKGFTGSNPPQDKCFLQIAENTGDPSICDSIQGGFMSYSKEECLRNVLQTSGPDGCTGKDIHDEMACRTAFARNGKECGDGYVYKNRECVTAPKTPADSGANDDIETKAAADLGTLKDAATGKYMDLLTKAIEDEQDDAKKKGLEAYKEFLEKGGEKLEAVQGGIDKLKEIKRIFLDAYDPSMDIEKMPVNKLLDPGLFDRIKERVFGADEPDARSKAEDALTVYEAMLKRQGDIDYLKKGRMERLQEAVVSKVKDDATGKLKEGAKEIAEGVAGTAFVAVGVVDHALTSFQEAAQKEMFIGLAAAYNRQRDAIRKDHPSLSPEEMHARTVASVKENPYADVPNAGFVKYGNLLENKDCQDEGNPLCIDNRVFWTAMGKTYEFQQKKR